MQSEEEPAPTPEPATIPTLQATADNLHSTHTVKSRPLSFRPERSAGPLSFRPDPERAQRVEGAVEKSASLPQLSHNPLPAITRGSCIPYPPAHPAYRQSSR
jgi:hypothetical protein